QIAEFEKSIQDVEEDLASLENQLARQDAEVLELTTAHQNAAESFAEGRMRLMTAEQRHVHLEQQSAALVASVAAAEKEWRTASEALAAARDRLQQRQTVLSEAESRIADNARRISELDEGRE